MLNRTLVALALIAWPNLSCATPPPSATQIAQRIWAEHEQVILESTTEVYIDLDRFEDAWYFFHRVTGIAVPGEHSSAINLRPNAETASALPLLQKWYSANKDRLYWDDDLQKVLLLPPKED